MISHIFSHCKIAFFSLFSDFFLVRPFAPWEALASFLPIHNPEKLFQFTSVKGIFDFPNIAFQPRSSSLFHKPYTKQNQICLQRIVAQRQQNDIHRFAIRSVFHINIGTRLASVQKKTFQFGIFDYEPNMIADCSG